MFVVLAMCGWLDQNCLDRLANQSDDGSIQSEIGSMFAANQ
jgi:hypothetical protein